MLKLTRIFDIILHQRKRSDDKNLLQILFQKNLSLLIWFNNQLGAKIKIKLSENFIFVKVMENFRCGLFLSQHIEKKRKNSQETVFS